MLPGLALAAMLIGLNPGGLLLGGLFAAIFVALGGHVIASSSRVKDETAVAALYIFAFAIGIALIKYARVKISLEHFLFGNVLGIADTDLLTSYCISVVTLLSLVALQRPLLLALFEASVARTQGIRVGLLLGLLSSLSCSRWFPPSKRLACFCRSAFSSCRQPLSTFSVIPTLQCLGEAGSSAP